MLGIRDKKKHKDDTEPQPPTKREHPDMIGKVIRQQEVETANKLKNRDNTIDINGKTYRFILQYKNGAYNGKVWRVYLWNVLAKKSEGFLAFMKYQEANNYYSSLLIKYKDRFMVGNI